MTVQSEPKRGTRTRNILHSFGEARIHLAVTEGEYVEPKTVYEAKNGEDLHQWQWAMKDQVKALQDNKSCSLVRPPKDRGRHTRQVGLQKEIGTYWLNLQIQNTLCSEVLQICGRSGLL